MDKIENLGLTYFLKEINVSGLHRYRDNFMIITQEALQTRDRRERRIPLRLEDYTVVIVEKGELNLHINYVPYCIRENSFLVLSVKHIIEIISFSDDYKGCILFIMSDFLKSILGVDKSPIIKDINFFLMNPVTRLDKKEFEIVQNNKDRLLWNINRHEHAYYARMVENELSNLILEIWNFKRLLSGKDIETGKTGNREIIVDKFLKLLLDHSSKEREVAFYANLLCVTPVYLSRSVKHVIGLPAIQVINDIVLTDARILLKQRDITIQQIAYELNFSDQAAFSKFFKNHTGISPMYYRKDTMNTIL